MRVDAFDFELPSERIALRPAVPRESARLLVVDDRLDDRRVADLPDLLRSQDLMVFNDTKVIPAQLSGRRGEAKIGLTLHRRLGPGRWRAFARPARRLRPADVVEIASGFQARVLARDGAAVDLDFDLNDSDLRAALEKHGEVPLPPYIGRRRAVDAADRDDYQTVYAAHEGAVAAPTAGLHFTPALLDQLAARGIGRAWVTLHVGAGTFLPVTVEDTSAHEMLPEHGQIDAATAETINRAREAGGRIVAVGSTSLRLIEAAADADGRVGPFDGETALFITPGYRFRVADLLLTNFHLPRSTLFMLVAAFSGLERMRAAYAHAIASGYRFYSYGDACLLRRREP
ncbi:MAG: tRNA preQ1(34) S-adenosylmethionine ribosyltransferase-isomerase QueA [Alphaproteobacteria bacterium]|jgi:S-adenosylmethionine:tRNA ribosyltransferase-isomerase|nr:tRNA preQ1(34) S-adenosylmethionine ribosyltransferase-isomerase QueA [Alphaproteobacteria bacterium]